MSIESYNRKEKEVKSPQNVKLDLNDEAVKMKIKVAQKILQANFLKAAQMDDPIDRERAMTKL